MCVFCSDNIQKAITIWHFMNNIYFFNTYKSSSIFKSFIQYSESFSLFTVLLNIIYNFYFISKFYPGGHSKHKQIWWKHQSILPNKQHLIILSVWQKKRRYAHNASVHVVYVGGSLTFETRPVSITAVTLLTVIYSAVWLVLWTKIILYWIAETCP